MKIMVWGTGILSRKVIEHINYINKIYNKEIIKIECFIDNFLDSYDKKHFGKNVISPNSLADNHLPIIIAVKNCEPIINQIKRNIGGEYYTYYEFVYKDILLWNENISCYGNIVEKKIQIQKAIINNKTKQYSYTQFIAGLMSLYSIDYTSANQMIISQNFNDKEHVKQKKNIAIYYNRLSNGGVERVISYLVKEFSERNYDVHLILDEVLVEEDYSIPSIVKVYKTDVKPHENCYQWFIGLAAYLKDNNIECFISHESYWEGDFYLYKLCQYIGTKFIIEIHNHHSGFVTSDNIEAYKMLYSNAHKVVVLNDDDVNFWKSNSIQTTKITNPVYVYQKKKEFTGKNVLWIGRITAKQKNVFEIIKTAKVLCEKKKTVTFHIVGSFESELLERKFMRLLEEYNLTSNFIFYGYQKEVSRYYQNSDVMIITSEYEGFSMTVAEAISYGVPVFAYELPYLEILKKKQGTICVPQGNYEALAEEMLKALDNKDYWEELSKDAYQCAIYFSKIDIIGEWEHLING